MFSWPYYFNDIAVIQKKLDAMRASNEIIARLRMAEDIARELAANEKRRAFLEAALYFKPSRDCVVERRH
jgi:hypothetical protein